MSTQTLRFATLSYDVERALTGELSKPAPDPLRIIRRRRLRTVVKQRFARLLNRA